MNAPPGWKLVPIEPTMAMVVAGGHALLAASFGDLDGAESETHATYIELHKLTNEIGQRYAAEQAAGQGFN